jgi:hypothetical protein
VAVRDLERELDKALTAYRLHIRAQTFAQIATYLKIDTDEAQTLLERGKEHVRLIPTNLNLVEEVAKQLYVYEEIRRTALLISGTQATGASVKLQALKAAESAERSRNELTKQLGLYSPEQMAKFKALLAETNKTAVAPPSDDGMSEFIREFVKDLREAQFSRRPKDPPRDEPPPAPA